MTRPKPIDEEIKLNTSRYIVSKTNTYGIIEYANDYFIKISGYNEDELLGRTHNIIRHPDMPKIMFKIMWKRLKLGKSTTVLIKNMTKEGKYYWVTTYFEPNKDPVTNDIVSYTAFRKSAPKYAIDKIIPIYKDLLRLEKKGGIEASERYLRVFLENNQLDYDKFIERLLMRRTCFTCLWVNLKRFFSING